MRAQRAPLRPTFSPARLCHVVYAGFSGGQMEDYPCVGQHISRRKNARRLSPSDLRTTLPDLRALAKRPLVSPHRAANWRRSVDDQPRACSQHRRARLSLQASAEKASQRRQEASDKPRKMTPDLVELIEEKLSKSSGVPMRSAGVWRRMASPLSVTSGSISMSGKTRKTGARCIFTCVTAAKNTTGARARIRGAG